MTHYDSLIAAIALAFGSAWASGINLYAVVFTLGLMGASGQAALPESLHVVQHPLVITVAGLLFVVEFIADKIPGVDSCWDAVHTFIRIPAGAALAAGAVAQVSPALMVAAGLAGGGLSAVSHATKAGSRLVINVSPEPFTNWAASLTEDVAVILGILMAVHHPWLFAVFLVLFLALMAWLLPKMFRLIRSGLKRIGTAARGGAVPRLPCTVEGGR